MKNTRRFLAAVMALAMVSAFSPMSAFAADTEIKPDTNGGPDPASAGLDVKYTYTIPNPTFTVTIPAGVELSDSADTEKAIKAEGIENLEENGKKIVVTLDSATNDDDDDTTFHAKNGDSDATYTITAGSNAVKIGDTVAEFSSNGADEVSSTLTFSKITLPESPVAGDYTETLTFGIAVTDAAPASPLAPAFKNGGVTSLSFTNFYNNYANRTFTFTNNNGTYVITAAEQPALKSVTQSGDKLIVIFGLTGEAYDEMDVTITLDKSDNSYSVSDPDGYLEVSDLTSVVVNGTDIKSQLTKK